MSKLTVPSTDITDSGGHPLLEGLQVRYGPITLLGRFFLLADALLAKAGVALYRTSLAEAAATQAANVSSWHMFPPMLDSRLSSIPPESSYGLLGRNDHGEVVCVQGGRVYDAPGRSLADLVADQSFLYGDEIPPATGLPTASVSAPSAAAVKGRFVYSGALWVHPDYRGRHLAGLLPRLSRCYALALWDTQFTVGMVREDNAVPQLLAAYGYNRIEPRFSISGLAPTPLSWLLMVMDRGELIADLTRFLDAQASQIDAAIRDSSTQDQALIVSNRNR